MGWWLRRQKKVAPSVIEPSATVFASTENLAAANTLISDATNTLAVVTALLKSAREEVKQMKELQVALNEKHLAMVAERDLVYEKLNTIYDEMVELMSNATGDPAGAPNKRWMARGR